MQRFIQHSITYLQATNLHAEILVSVILSAFLPITRGVSIEMNNEVHHVRQLGELNLIMCILHVTYIYQERLHTSGRQITLKDMSKRHGVTSSSKNWHMLTGIGFA